MKRVLKTKFAILLLLTTCALGSIHSVPSDYPTIQAGIDASVDGDVVLVAPGTYTGEGNRDINFRGKAITVKSEGGPETCIVDCQSSREEYHRGFNFNNGEDTNSIAQGFTIINGYALHGGGILCDASGPLIKNCIVIANEARTGGGGIDCSDSNSIIDNCIISGNKVTSFYHDGGGLSIFGYSGSGGPTLINCVISGNYATGDGGGISCGKSNSSFINCTIYGNRAAILGGGIACGTPWDNMASMQNCIIWGNEASYGGEQMALTGGGVSGQMRLKLVYCVVQNEPNAIKCGLDCSKIEGDWTSTEPFFIAPGYWESYEPNAIYYQPPPWIRWIEGDYHLKSQAGRWDPNSQNWIQDDVTSACIDAGDPNSPIGHEPFPNGGIINIGAYGGTAEASKSYFGRPVCETIIAGDINGDCKVDFADFAIMAAHWLEER